MSVQHNTLTTTDLHVPGYQQDADPGTIGAGRFWVDSTLGTGLWALKTRNAANDGWEDLGSGQSWLKTADQTGLTGDKSGSFDLTTTGILTLNKTIGAVRTARTDTQNSIVVANTTAGTSGSKIQDTPSIKLSGQYWDGAVSQEMLWYIWGSDNSVQSNSELRVACKRGAGALTQILRIDAGGQFGIPYKYAAYDIRETLNNGFQLSNDAAATVTYDQYTPYLTLYSKGWKTDATAGSQSMSCGWINAPEQGAISPQGVHLLVYGTNVTYPYSPTITNELVRYEWGDDIGSLGVDFNKLGLANYHFNVTATSADFGATPITTTGTVSASYGSWFGDSADSNITFSYLAADVNYPEICFNSTGGGLGATTGALRDALIIHRVTSPGNPTLIFTNIDATVSMNMIWETTNKWLQMVGSQAAGAGMTVTTYLDPGPAIGANVVGDGAILGFSARGAGMFGDRETIAGIGGEIIDITADQITGQLNFYAYDNTETWTEMGTWNVADGLSIIGTFSAEQLNSTDDADIAGTLTAGDLVTDTGGLTLLGGQSIKPSVDSVSAINFTNAAGTLKQIEIDTSTPRLYVRVGDSGIDPAWNATDIMVLEAAANTNASLQFFTGNAQIGAFRFSRPSLTVPPYTSGRNKGGFGYNHSTDTMFFAATLGVTFTTAGILRSTIESDGDWQHTAINHYFANGTTYKIESDGDVTFKDFTMTSIVTMGGTAPVADATYAVYNDGVTSGQVTGFTTKSGIITAITTVP